MDFYENLKLYPELKLRNDDHNNHFSNGLSMCGSMSTRDLTEVFSNDLEVKYKNSYGHTLIIHKKKFKDILEVYTTFENTGEAETIIEMISSCAISGIKADNIHRIQSFWSMEGRVKTESTNSLQLEPSWSEYAVRCEKFGNLGSMPIRKYFPFVAFSDARSENFIGVSLYSPSSWQFEILCQIEELSMSCGIADRDFGHWFKKIGIGETFTTPKAVIACGKSLDEVCDKLVKHQNPNVSKLDVDMPIIFNEFCTTWGNPNFNNIKRIADKIKGRGIKYLVVDCGWYADETGWEITIGDWKANSDMFPNGLIEVSEYIKKCGMVPGIWFEMEIVGRNAKAFHMTEHLLKKDDVVITTGDRRFWDMTDPWVIEYLSNKVIKLLKECGFGYLKVDYNDNIGIGCDGAESLGEGLRTRVLGSQAFFRKIKAEIPDLVIENCSSGGHRLEPSMMELVSEASFSDAHETLAIPIIAGNLHRTIKPSQSQIWAVLRRGDNANRLYYSLCSTFLGRMCLSGDIYDLSDQQWNVVKNGIKFYNDVSDIIKNGTTIFNKNDVDSYNKPKGEQIVVRDFCDRRLVVVHRFENSENVSLDFLNGYSVISTFGSAEDDFSAMAWHLKLQG